MQRQAEERKGGTEGSTATRSRAAPDRSLRRTLSPDSDRRISLTVYSSRCCRRRRVLLSTGRVECAARGSTARAGGGGGRRLEILINTLSIRSKHLGPYAASRVYPRNPDETSSDTTNVVLLYTRLESNAIKFFSILFFNRTRCNVCSDTPTADDRPIRLLFAAH